MDYYVLRLIAEIDNPSMIGIGTRFETVLLELDAELGTKLQRNANVGTTRTQWLTTVNYYQTQAYAQLKIYRAECDREIDRIRELMNSAVLNGLIDNCKIALNDVNQMQGVNNEIIEAAVNDLRNGYAFMKANSQYISFKDGEGERYTREGAMPESQAMLSVPDVWKDLILLWLIILNNSLMEQPIVRQTQCLRESAYSMRHIRRKSFVIQIT